MTWADTKQLIANIWPPKATFLPKDYKDLKGQVVLITGANSGVGYEAVKLLIPTGARIYILSRSAERLEAAIAELKKQFPAADLHYILVDFNDLTTVKGAANSFLAKESRLDILIHNAGVMALPTGTKTKQGFEAHLGINVMGPTLLQELLTPILFKTASEINTTPNAVRVLFLNSTAHGQSSPKGFDYDKLEDLTRPWMLNYGDSKAETGIMILQWAKAHPAVSAKIPVLLVDPGYAKTGLQQHLSWFEAFFVNMLLNDPIISGYTVAYCALSPDLTVKNTGDYIIPPGRIGRMRDDVKESCTNEDGKKLRQWILERVLPYA
ncbi:unnamed protein product [Kuraishia capsulata CBS 1993]|uniref:Ketoreductase (KR) domain-containing protein n=1 Tax=Kuraishia capsulata CBS 1993 TaxID=1382522 RepID=W6MTM5_9ASCO|nr:uncharacterized protein KUCA_T00001102001 [Kuraishia capsulata CBS 1993]CDK25135.1 unnamed protein product [Kuraishia capsulata CBS 1993]